MTIEDYEGCPRYIGRLFRDVTLGPSPPWLKARLTAAGMRPISNVVDVTNYVMLALGNPLHAFDFETLRGGRIVVRRARAGEEFTSLDGNLRKLDPADLVIADAEGAIAFAGIMGGLDTEVTESTTSVLLEAANFEPGTILWSSERHALRTEGSNRWEKGVDPYLAPARRPARHAAHGRARRRALDRRHATSGRRAARAARSSTSAPAARTGSSGSRSTSRSRRTRSSASASTSSPAGTCTCPPGACATRRARSTSSRRSRASTGSRRSPSPCRSGARCSGGSRRASGCGGWSRTCSPARASARRTR